MANCALMLLTLLTNNNNNNIITKMFDINYLRTLEKHKIIQHYESKRYKIDHIKVYGKKHKTFYSNNYNIAKR